MVYATSEQELMSAFDSSMDILQIRPISINKTEVELCKFRNEKKSHVQHMTYKKGSKGRHGSSLDQSNHLSIIVFLNDGEKLLNLCCSCTSTLVQDFFKFQQMYINKFNKITRTQKIKLDVKRRRFTQSIPPALKQEIESLCLNYYLKFKARVFCL